MFWYWQVRCWEIVRSGVNVSSMPKASISHDQPVIDSYAASDLQHILKIEIDYLFISMIMSLSMQTMQNGIGKEMNETFIGRKYLFFAFNCKMWKTCFRHTWIYWLLMAACTRSILILRAYEATLTFHLFQHIFCVSVNWPCIEWSNNRALVHRLCAQPGKMMDQLYFLVAVTSKWKCGRCCQVANQWLLPCTMHQLKKLLGFLRWVF